MSEDVREALLAYGAFLGLDRDALADPALLEETAALLEALAAASKSELGETPLPLAFAPPQP